MGLLRDYEPSDRPLFEALIFRSRGEGEGGCGVSHITPSIIVPVPVVGDGDTFSQKPIGLFITNQTDRFLRCSLSPASI